MGVGTDDLQLRAFRLWNLEKRRERYGNRYNRVGQTIEIVGTYTSVEELNIEVGLEKRVKF